MIKGLEMKQQYATSHRWKGLCFALLFLGIAFSSRAQDQNFIAVVPTLMDRQHAGEWESPLQLTQQRFILLLYHNAAAVYSEADFINTGDDTVSAELALPSTGYRLQNHSSWAYQSNGLLGIRMWVAGERAEPQLITDEPVEWYTIQPVFPPGIATKIKTLFWVQTSLTDVDSIPGVDTIAIVPGERGLVLDIADASVWKEAISSVEATVIMKEGLTPHDTLLVDPDDYETTDSTLTWNLSDVEPSTFDNILIKYNSAEHRVPAMSTMEQLNDYILREGYNELLEYVGQLDED
jgi:hypothetical protein